MQKTTIPDAAELNDLAGPLRAMRLQFEAVLEPHRPALWEYCRRLTGSGWDAEDLVQQTMMKAFANLPNLWQPMNPRSYLFRIASNCWIDQVRRERHGQLDELDDYPDPSPADRMEALVETRAAMTRLVHLLPPRQRVVLLLCDALDFRAAEVAAMLGTTEGAVKAALHRARTTLAGAQGEAGPGRTALGEPGTPMHAVIQRYIDAFNARDAEAIAALLDEDAVVAIVGSAEEHGRAMIRSASLHEWATDPREQWARAGVLEGRPAIFVFYRTDGREALAWIATLEVGPRSIRSQRIYYFCPELTRYAADRLGVPAVTHGYQWTGST
jgi:RNA polymerase sigma-70 factor (ECF subfamily)